MTKVRFLSTFQTISFSSNFLLKRLKLLAECGNEANNPQDGNGMYDLVARFTRTMRTPEPKSLDVRIDFEALMGYGYDLDFFPRSEPLANLTDLYQDFV